MTATQTTPVTQLSKLGALNIRAIIETAGDHKLPILKQTATTLTFQATPAEVIEGIDRSLKANPKNGHPRSSLWAVRRRAVALADALPPTPAVEELAALEATQVPTRSRKGRAHDSRGRGLSEAATPPTPEEREHLAQLIQEAAATSKRKGRKAAAATLTLVPTPEEPSKAPRKSLPNAERRTEATHGDGGSAVAHGPCAKCGAKLGVLCTSSLGKPTNFVHSPRMAAWEADGSPELHFISPLSRAGKAQAKALAALAQAGAQEASKPSKPTRARKASSSTSAKRADAALARVAPIRDAASKATRATRKASK